MYCTVLSVGCIRSCLLTCDRAREKRVGIICHATVALSVYLVKVCLVDVPSMGGLLFTIISTLAVRALVSTESPPNPHLKTDASRVERGF